MSDHSIRFSGAKKLPEIYQKFSEIIDVTIHWTAVKEHSLMMQT
jgi:hypothetical protein